MSAFRYAWNWALSRLLRRLADAHRHFGNLYSNKQEHLAAVGNYTRAIVHDPFYAEAIYSRGVLCWRELGRPGQAIQDLTRTLELEPTRAEAYFNRGLAYKLNRQPDLAAADFEQYLEVGKDEFWLDAARRQLEEVREDLSASSKEQGQETGP